MTPHVAGHDGIYLCAIIKEGHAAPSIDPHLGYILDSLPSLEGVRIQEESLCALLYALGNPSGDIIGMVTFI